MTTTVLSSSFPSDGKVLVVGLFNQAIEEEFTNRALFTNHWEVQEEKPPSRFVAAIIFSVKLADEIKTRIISVVNKQRESPVLIYLEQNPIMARERLKIVLTGVDLDIDPDRPKATPLAINPTTAISVTVKGSEVSPTEIEGALLIDPKRTRPLKGQPRSYFNTKKMLEIETSIRSIGQLMPVLVRRISDDPNYDYELIEGERRHRVCLKLNRPLLAIIRTVQNSEHQFMASFGANFAREGHTALEHARGIQRILDFECLKHLSHRQRVIEAAKVAGRTEVWAYQYLRLLKLPQEVQDMLEPRNEDDETSPLPASMGFFLCTIEDAGIQLEVARRMVAEELSLKQAKQLATELATKAGITVGSPTRTPKSDYRILRRCLRNAREGATGILGMQNRTLDDLFAHRSDSDRQVTIAEIDDLIGLLKRMRSGIALREVRKAAAS